MQGIVAWQPYYNLTSKLLEHGADAKHADEMVRFIPINTASP